LIQVKTNGVKPNPIVKKVFFDFEKKSISIRRRRIIDLIILA